MQQLPGRGDPAVHYFPPEEPLHPRADALGCGRTSANLSGTRYLDDAKTPPGSTDTTNGKCRTRTASITSSFAVYKIPLTVAMLSTATGNNNVGAFDFAGDSTTATGTG